MTDAERLGDNIRRRRLILGLTQSLTAERANISRTTLNRIETGKGGSLRHFLAITRVLGISEDILAATDPLATDLGRARAHLLNRQRAPRR